MNKSIYFMTGLILAGIGAAGFWALKTEQRPIEPLKKESKKVSLLTINYIPTSPAKPLSETKFWQLPANDGDPIEKDLKDLAGKPIILHFWATWCGPCVKELPDLDAYSKNLEDTAHVIAIVTDMKDVAKVREFYRTKGIQNLNIYFDKSGQLTRTFRTPALPTSIFINSQGHEIGRIQGAIEWNGNAGRLLNIHLSKN
jgi:thiol-disulfide isomerase/thioredoxin